MNVKPIIASVLLLVAAACESESYHGVNSESHEYVRNGERITVYPPYEYLERHTLRQADYLWDDSLACRSLYFPFSGTISIHDQAPGQHSLTIRVYYTSGSLRASRTYFVVE